MHRLTTPPRLKPCVYEHPVLRLMFKAPDGSTHQSTITSSWRQSAGFTENRFFGTDDESIAFRAEVCKACEALVFSIGCTLQSLEIVSQSVTELLV